MTALKVRIRSLGALAQAAAACGLELKRDQKEWKWFGEWVDDYHAEDAAYQKGVDPTLYGQCKHALAVKGNRSAYEIGVIDHPDGKGGYMLLYDFYGSAGRTVQDKVGKNGEKLQQAYNVAVTMNRMKAKGYSAQTETLKNGTKRLVFAKL